MDLFHGFILFFSSRNGVSRMCGSFHLEPQVLDRLPFVDQLFE
jgi:hypothetical protein